MFEDRSYAIKVNGNGPFSANFNEDKECWYIHPAAIGHPTVGEPYKNSYVVPGYYTKPEDNIEIVW